MKMSQLKMAIREVVREEIRLGLKEVIGEVKKQTVQKPKPKQKQNQNVRPGPQGPGPGPKVAGPKGPVRPHMAPSTRLAPGYWTCPR